MKLYKKYINNKYNYILGIARFLFDCKGKNWRYFNFSCVRLCTFLVQFFSLTWNISLRHIWWLKRISLIVFLVSDMSERCLFMFFFYSLPQHSANWQKGESCLGGYLPSQVSNRGQCVSTGTLALGCWDCWYLISPPPHMPCLWHHASMCEHLWQRGERRACQPARSHCCEHICLPDCLYLFLRVWLNLSH